MCVLPTTNIIAPIENIFSVWRTSGGGPGTREIGQERKQNGSVIVRQRGHM